MSVFKLSTAMGYIDDELISEAISYHPINSKKHHKWIKCFVAAACLAIVLTPILLAIHRTPSITDVEPFIPMTIDEVQGSIYSGCIPNLKEIGYSFDTAGIYNQEIFKASFFSDQNEIDIQIISYSSTLHENRIIDMNTVYQTENIAEPIFFAEQFNFECVEYLNTELTASGRIVTQFSILKNGYVAQYILKCDSQDEIAKAIECICLCYN